MYGDTCITQFKDNIAEMFECGERDKVENITEEIMEDELQRRYPGDYYLPLFPTIKSSIGQKMNKKRAQEIIDFDDHIYSSRRRGCKALYREKR